MNRRLKIIVTKLLDHLKTKCTKTKTNMATQIIDDGVEIRIVTNGIPKIVTKANIKTVEVLINTTIKMDIGKEPLRNIYIDQLTVDSPVNSGPADLRDKIAAMLQPLAQAGTTATAANQLLQTAELQSIKTSVSDVSTKLSLMNDNMVLEPKLIDETEGRIIYKGYAIPGTDENANVWAIQRITNTDGNFAYHWASGTKNFDKRWSLRREYQYS